MMWLMEFKLAGWGVGLGVGVGVGAGVLPAIPWQPASIMMAAHEQLRTSAVVVVFILIPDGEKRSLLGMTQTEWLLARRLQKIFT